MPECWVRRQGGAGADGRLGGDLGPFRESKRAGGEDNDRAAGRAGAGCRRGENEDGRAEVGLRHVLWAYGEVDRRRSAGKGGVIVGTQMRRQDDGLPRRRGEEVQ